MPQPIQVGINGFGRIGRKIARLAFANDAIEIVGINDLSKPEQIAHLLKYDSVHGRLNEDIRVEGSMLIVGRRKIQLFAEKDPAALPWGKIGAKFVHECTGHFTDREKAALHLKGGASKVIVSAPSANPDRRVTSAGVLPGASVMANGSGGWRNVWRTPVTFVPFHATASCVPPAASDEMRSSRPSARSRR